MYKGFLSSLLYGANPWHLAIILTCCSIPSIMSCSIISIVFSNDEVELTIEMSKFVCSIGYSDYCPSSKVDKCCLLLNTSKIHVLSFLS